MTFAKASRLGTNIISNQEWEDKPWEKGAVTAEFATALPAVMVIFAIVIAMAAAFGTQFRVSDAARTGARLVAMRAESGRIRTSIIQIAGGQPEVSISQAGSWATVKVKRSLHLGPIWLTPLSVTGIATSWVEP
jgi:hypothetical protein